MAHHLPFTPLSKEAVASIFGVSTRTIESWVEHGLMPAPSAIGARVFWHPDLFYEWLDQRLRIPRDKASEPMPTKAVVALKGSPSEKNQLRAHTAKRLARIEADL
jgi:DNA-binding transcriptional MerR regulator